MAETFFLWSMDGSTLFLARRLEAEGHRVLFYTWSHSARLVGRGIVEKPTDDHHIPAGAIVLIDSTGHGVRGKQLRAAGYKVIGGNELDTKLEVDRAAGEALLKENGVAIPETIGFTSIDDALRILEDKDGPWFVKLSGDVGTATTHNTPDSATMSRYLRWLRGHGDAKGELQRRMAGTEVSIEGWFDGERFVPPFNCTIEEKNFLAGGFGPRTGCETCVVWPLDGDAPALAQQTLLRLTTALTGYVGPLDLNCMVSPEGIAYVLEPTARPGYDAFQASTALLEEGMIGDQLAAFARGDLKEWRFRPEAMALTLRLSVPPYPTEDREAVSHESGLPLDPSILDDPMAFAAEDIMLDGDGLPAVAGRDGFVGVLVSVGSDIAELRREIFSRAHSLKITIPRLQCRPDPVARAERDWQALAEIGLLDTPWLEDQLVSSQVEKHAAIELLDALEESVSDALRLVAKDYRSFLRLAEAAEPEMIRAFLRAVAATVDAVVLRRVEEALDRRDLAGAVQAVGWDAIGEQVLRGAVPEQLRGILEEAGQLAGNESGLGLDFDLADPRAAAWARSYGAGLVTDVGDETRSAIRLVVARAIETGGPLRDSAREIVSLVGLTQRDALAVQRYRAQLLGAGRLRGRADSMAESYAKRLLRARAETITQTETLMAAHKGLEVYWLQARDEGLLPDTARRKWITAHDERECPICRPLDGVTTRIGEAWQTAAGPVMTPQETHPRCRCSELLVGV